MAAPGWHGKLPTLGDFASRRLDAGFIESWDSWLAEGIAYLQETNRSAWLQAYLDSPSWRFLLMPDVLPGRAGAQPWVGVLMPSVDRVGRYFPFTVAEPLLALPATAQDCRQLSDWFDRVDDIAVDALYDDWTVERLEQELQAVPLPAFSPALASVSAATSAFVFASNSAAASTAPALGDAPQPGHRADVLLTRAVQAFCNAAPGSALWLGSANEAQHRSLTTRGLPKRAAFASLLGRNAAGDVPPLL